MIHRQLTPSPAIAFITRARVMFAALLLAACLSLGGCAQTYHLIRLPDGSAPIADVSQQEGAAATFTETPSGTVPGTRVLAVGDTARLTLTSGRRVHGLVQAVGDTILLQSVHRNKSYVDVIPARTVTRVELAGKPMTPIEKSIVLLGVPVLVGVLVIAAVFIIGGPMNLN